MLLLASLLALSFTSPAHDELRALAHELRDVKVQRDGIDLYATAFTGYALVDAGRDGMPDARDLLDELIAHVVESDMRGVFKTGERVIEGRRISSSVIYRGHLALMLVGRSRLRRMPESSRTFMNALLDSLADDVKRSPNGLLPSYGTREWPADNEVALAALALRHGDPNRRMLEALDVLAGAGLPPSEIVPGTLKRKDVPRGCALSWSVAMRGLHDVDAARALYGRYRAEFWMDYGVVQGFREWPRGVERKEDFDSGPIIMGIGVAASGIGLGAARVVGEDADAWTLRRSATVAGLPFLRRQSGREARVLRAMALWAEGARTWSVSAPMHAR